MELRNIGTWFEAQELEQYFSFESEHVSDYSIKISPVPVLLITWLWLVLLIRVNLY